ncbi:Rv3235 family protein [Mumia sp. DW29H23]|uniref:Rv3235 family protein n=1 Tax=Mumia sp. DW29H23 TaxID=3421241 RepID=UPI003D68D80F
MTAPASGADLYALDRAGRKPPARAVQWSLPLVEGSLALATAPLADPHAAAIAERPRLSLVPPPERELEQRAGRFVQAVLEVTAGTRPLQQLVRVVRPDVYEEMQHRLAVLARASTRAPRVPAAGRVASIRVYRPREDAAEVTARVVRDGLSRAIAARLELDTDRRDPTWVCVALCWV